MNRNWHRHAMGGLPILSAALLSTVGLMGQGAWSDAAAQTYSGQSNEVIVNYDVLNGLPGQPSPYGNARAATPPKSQFLPGYAPNGYTTALPPYTPYGTQPGITYAAPLAPGLAAPPPGTPTSVLTTLGPDGRPITPIKLRKPGSGTQSAQKPKKVFSAPVQSQPVPADEADSQVAAVTPPAEPAEVPETVPMPEPTPNAPAPGVNSGEVPEAPVVETPAPPAEEAAPAAEAPAEQPAEQPVEEQASQEQPAETPAPEAPAAEEQPAEGEAAKTEEEQPAEEAAAETPPEPDNTQAAAPIPEGGIRIVFPTELNEVPSEANAALDDLAAQMLADESMRIQIMCYASGTEDTESKARRKSLARCINIRQYLFKKDVRTTRMDVRALGLKSEGQPADRVDIVPAAS